MPDAAPSDIRVLTFVAGGELLALDAAAVAEVAPMPRVTRVPQSPAALRGLASVRGQVTPILSLDVLLGAEAASADEGERLIVIGGADPVGLAVEGVNAMRTARAAAGDGKDGVAAIVQTQDGAIRLLNVDGLLRQGFARMGASRRGSLTAVATPDRAEPTRPELAFLQCELAGQAYALALEQVREVVAAPTDAVALPHADAVMLGVTQLRGDLVALVSLRALLGLPPAPADAGSSVVVAALGAATVGLVVDRVQGIIRAQDSDVGPVPGVLNRGAGEARIDAIVRTAGGLVSVLAAERIFEEESVAQILAEGAGRTSSEAESTREAATEQFVVFRLGDESYGLPIGSVSEVLRLPATLTRVPRAPDFLAGVMNHRGQVVPLIDQRRRFGAEPGAAAAGRRVVVARLDDVLAGFVVDGVDEVLRVPAERLSATPALASGNAAIFDRVASVEHDGRLVLLVDPRQLLDQAERDILRELADDATSEAS